MNITDELENLQDRERVFKLPTTEIRRIKNDIIIEEIVYLRL